MALNELTDPAAVVQAMAEFDQLGRTAFLQKYGFGKAREYMLRGPSGTLYDSKAIAGAAFGFQFPDRGPLRATDFSGGENTVERKLADLGFEVVRIGGDWTRVEVELTVADYLDMLALEAKGIPFKKSEHNRQLRTRLRARSKSSIEFKHQNISAVLDELNLPHIRGYTPMTNIQDLLREVVREAISARQSDLLRMVDDFEAVRPSGRPDYAAVLTQPPQPIAGPPTVRRPRLPRKLDYAARDEQNRNLGRAGEGWTVGYEGHRLQTLNRDDLAQRIDWISDRLGDGAGYDIASFDDDESERYIEVKTTNGGAQTPFIVSSNELEFSKETGPAFFLYRVYDYGTNPHLFILRGALSDTLALTPMDYRARVKSL